MTKDNQPVSPSKPNRKAFHVRKPSDGNVQGAFYVNPTIPEPYALSKREENVLKAKTRERNQDNRIELNDVALKITSDNTVKRRSTTSDIIARNISLTRSNDSRSIDSRSIDSMEHSDDSQNSVPERVAAQWMQGSKKFGARSQMMLNDWESPGITDWNKKRELSTIRDISADSLDFSLVNSISSESSLNYDALRENLMGINISNNSTTNFRNSATSINDENRQQEIATFSSMATSTYEYPSMGSAKPKIYQRSESDEKQQKKNVKILLRNNENNLSFFLRIREYIEGWLREDEFYDAEDKDKHNPCFPEDEGKYTFRGIVRKLLYNPAFPEFTSTHQAVWSILIGISMGIYTAYWKLFIEFCVDFVWREIPAYLKETGFFTELDGGFPMTHYMWICPTIYGCVLSYAFAALPTKIPNQNDWISNIHSKGVQEADTFLQLFLLATLSFTSGLSLGPELPLVLTAGMAGSYLGILTRQSVLQARVLNLVAASSAVGGFFGFPMAGALFVLELPHRSGVQYFEALTPAIMGSIVSVLTNRLIVKNDVTGYYKYPFLTSSLPSYIFWHAIIFGLFGTVLGIMYAKSVLKLKKWVHDIFHYHEDTQLNLPGIAAGKNISGDTDDEETGELDFSAMVESSPLVPKTSQKFKSIEHVDYCSLFNQIVSMSKRGIKSEPHRAAVAGAIAGCLVGVIGMFLPHVMFWGESQLQSLIDKGRTPLPIFGRENEPTADLTAWSRCLVERSNELTFEDGYPLVCSISIVVAKIMTTGLSLGTGIIAGHFWGPLFIGCAASHLLTDFANLISHHFFGQQAAISTYPCVAMLCTMGACHVVTFRAHTAIMLTLTLTISAFADDNSSTGGINGGGDYSAVFPLLVVSVFIAMTLSKEVVTFYATQRCRGDIMALPEVLCEPGKEGAPMAPIISDINDQQDHSYNEESQTPSSDNDENPDPSSNMHVNVGDSAREEIEMNFESTILSLKGAPAYSRSAGSKQSILKTDDNARSLNNDAYFTGLDKLLSEPLETSEVKKNSHRRVASLPAKPVTKKVAPSSPKTQRKERFQRISSFGEMRNFQPSLMDQARDRASSSRHSRTGSFSNSLNSSSPRSRVNSLDQDFRPRSRVNSADQAIRPRSRMNSEDPEFRTSY